MTRYAQHFSTVATPQTQPIPGSDQVPNSAGGFTWAVDDFQRLNRWLIMGSAGGTYYASEAKLTVENAECVLRCLNADPVRTVQAIVETSDGGRAPKNEPAVFALAIAAGHKNPAARKAALNVLPRVCRTPTDLFAFWAAVRGFRGRGHGLRRAVAAWYTERPVAQLGYQVAKYQARNGWSHRDLLRLVRPETDDPGRAAVLRWAVRSKDGLGARTVLRVKRTVEYPDVSAHLPAFLAAVDEARNADEATVLRLVREHGLPRECIPTERLNSPAVWEALLARMPLTAMVRNLGKMTAVGLLQPFSDAAKTVADRLGDREYIRKSRLHPMSLLIAGRTYGHGHGDKGKLSWVPVSAVNDALDAAFYLAFDNVVPIGKRILLALDVSGSMGSGVAGLPITCREAAAAMAMVMARTEKQYQVVAFTAAASGGVWGRGTSLTMLDISGCSRLTDVVQRTSCLAFGATDCSLPVMAAIQQGWPVDAFAIYTDNETYMGQMHPSQALAQYRQKSGIPARLAVAAFTATQFSIADPNDPGMLDVAGLDTSTPAILSDFLAGRI